MWVTGLVLAGCYHPPSSSPCAITCTSDCPDDLTCDHGFCVAPGETCEPSFVQVATGTGFACGLDDNHALWCWGSNAHHVISQDAVATVPEPTRVATSFSWDAISAGADHVCGLTAGQLYCWGGNDHFEAGAIGGDVLAPTPIAVAGVTAWSSVSAGSHATCAIAAGHLYCWGEDDYGELGQNGGGPDVEQPVEIMPGPDGPITDWTVASIGTRHGCAISASKGVLCWGQNDSGQCGRPPSAPQPVPAVALASPAIAVATTNASTCAIDATGALLCWGQNAYAELGEEQAGMPDSATPVPATTTTGWTQIRGTATSLCGLAGSDVYCWGDAAAGGLGEGVWNDVGWAHVLTGATAIDTGWSYRPDTTQDLDLACAVVGTDIRCWGDNRFGQLGHGNATMSTVPAEIALGHVYSALAIGGEHACGIAASGVECWGSTLDAQATAVIAGNGGTEGLARTPCVAGADCDVATPKPIGLAPNATAIAAGSRHTCALHDGALTCWGGNDNDQLTLGTGTRKDVGLVAGAAWQALYPTGGLAQCASPVSGGIYCWGDVERGLVETPTLRPELAGATRIAMNTIFACALIGEDLQCIGDTAAGEFGNGMAGGCAGDGVCQADENPSNCPGDCGSGPLSDLKRTYTQLALPHEGESACGITPSQTVECWGFDGRGQTSEHDPTTGAVVAESYIAVPVAGLSACTSVTVGNAHACAICAGSISCWGDDSIGQLGDGKLDPDPVPTPRTIALQLDGDPWLEVAAGNSFTCARSSAGRVFCWGFDPHAALGNGASGANLPTTVRAGP